MAETKELPKVYSVRLSHNALIAVARSYNAMVCLFKGDFESTMNAASDIAAVQQLFRGTLDPDEINEITIQFARLIETATGEKLLIVTPNED